MKFNLIFTAAFLGLLAVLLGAFGAHALKEVLSADQLNSYETGVRFQMYHAIVLLILGFVTQQFGIKQLIGIGQLMTVGIILFSSSIYLLATKDLIGMPALKALGPITPIGGLLLIISWGLLCWRALNGKLSQA